MDKFGRHKLLWRIDQGVRSSKQWNISKITHPASTNISKEKNLNHVYKTDQLFPLLFSLPTNFVFFFFFSRSHKYMFVKTGFSIITLKVQEISYVLTGTRQRSELLYIKKHHLLTWATTLDNEQLHSQNCKSSNESCLKNTLNIKAVRTPIQHCTILIYV